MERKISPSKHTTLATPEYGVPSDLKKALNVTPKALQAWNDITPIARRDFITWIESAKQAETRARRVTVACSKLVSGKRRPCCYAVVPMPLYKALGTNPKAKATWSTLTPDERRDLSAFVDDKNQSGTKDERIQHICKILTLGKRTIHKH